MANAEHLAKLKEGVEAWNAWRQAHPDVMPDLRQANLRGATLRGAWLSKTNFYGATLREVDLFGAILSGANLREADLFGAILSGADFGLADLSGATLKEVNLRWAHLIVANLSRVDLTEAILQSTSFGETNFTDAIGLDTCRHYGPSYLDPGTLLRSSGLPEAFLRGCGWPDVLIATVPALLNDPIQFYSCFISHSSEDQAFAERLHADLQGKGVRCWYAPEDIRGGRKLHEQLDQAIRVHGKLLLVLSKFSMRSDWVEYEIRRARRYEVRQKRRILFPVRLVDYDLIEAWECFDADTKRDLATEVREYFISDFSNWKDHDAYQHAFVRLLRDLQAAGSSSG